MSTSEASQMLGVGTSTLKRWADEGLLESYRTAGGHRRFSKDAVVQFLESRLQAKPQDPVPDEAAWLRLLGEEGDIHRIVAAILKLRAETGSYAAVADQLGQVLDGLGRAWAESKLTVLEEHVASERLARGLAWCTQSLVIPPGAPTALLVSAEGDDHTLGLSLAELVLREAGWHSRWAGRRTPLADILAALTDGGVDLLAVSASVMSQDQLHLRREVEQLAKTCEQEGVRLILGGKGAWPDAPPYGKRLRSFRELAQFLADERAT